MAENDAGAGFDLDGAHRFELRLGEVADLLLREANGIERARGHGGDAFFDLLVRELERGRIPLVQFARITARGFEAVSLDVGDDFGDDLARRRIVGGLVGGRRSFFVCVVSFLCGRGERAEKKRIGKNAKNRGCHFRIISVRFASFYNFT